MRELQVEAREVCNTYDTNYKDHETERFIVKGSDKEKLFGRLYERERSLRYCYGYRVEFLDSTLQKEYQNWKDTGHITIELYYGGGIVD